MARLPIHMYIGCLAYGHYRLDFASCAVILCLVSFFKNKIYRDENVRTKNPLGFADFRPIDHIVLL